MGLSLPAAAPTPLSIDDFRVGTQIMREVQSPASETPSLPPPAAPLPPPMSAAEIEAARTRRKLQAAGVPDQEIDAYLARAPKALTAAR